MIMQDTKLLRIQFNDKLFLNVFRNFFAFREVNEFSGQQSTIPFKPRVAHNTSLQ